MMNLCLKDKAEQALLEGSSMIKAMWMDEQPDGETQVLEGSQAQSFCPRGVGAHFLPGM